MKQFIVLMAMIALGVFLYTCIAGGGDSVLTALKALWRNAAISGPYHGTVYGYPAFPGYEVFFWKLFNGGPLFGGPV